MTARPDYWGGAPAIDEIVFRVYNSNEAVVQALLKGAIDYTLDHFPGAVRGREGHSPTSRPAVDSAEAFHQLSFNLAEDPKSSGEPGGDGSGVPRKPWRTPSTGRR